MAAYVKPFSSSVNWVCALGMTAPDGSLTTPVSEPLKTWANETRHSASTAAAALITDIDVIVIWADLAQHLTPKRCGQWLARRLANLRVCEYHIFTQRLAPVRENIRSRPARLAFSN